MNTVSEVAGAIGSISDLVAGILDRADRDGPDKELNENITKIQNAFAGNDLDEQYRLYYRLFSDAGIPPTPGGNVGEQERIFRHGALTIAARLIHERKLATRALNALMKK